MRFLVLVASLCVGVTLGQYAPTTTPVPILKQINRHNEDGSYSYGFEAADGSYKIESKYPTGEVYGKYGFVDDTGNVREIEYGASRRGFEPAGTGINVPPPTVNDNRIGDGKNEPDDDGQYREDPSIYYTDPRYTNGERYDPVPKRFPIQNHQLQQRPIAYNAVPTKSVASAYRAPQQVAPQQYQPVAPQQYQPVATQQYQPVAPRQYQPVAPRPYQPEYQPTYRTQYQRQQQPAPAAYRPAPAAPQQYYGAQADPNFASYSVKYRR